VCAAPALDTEPCPSNPTVFEGRKEKGEWRVEYFDDDGGCYVTIFAGPGAPKASARLCGRAQGWSLEGGYGRAGPN
jgi:hypothetical protein